jgi:hypothetical protein
VCHPTLLDAVHDCTHGVVLHRRQQARTATPAVADTPKGTKKAKGDRRPPRSRRVLPERCGIRAKAEVRATELRTRLARVNGLGPQASCVLRPGPGHAGHARRDAHRRPARGQHPPVQVELELTWVPADIGDEVRCLDFEIKHWAAIFDHPNGEGASTSTVKNIARTLGVLMEWAVDRGYFASAEPSSTPRRRRKIVKKAKKRARIVKAEIEVRFLFATCPKVADVEKYAAAFEEVYPATDDGSSCRRSRPVCASTNCSRCVRTRSTSRPAR